MEPASLAKQRDRQAAQRTPGRPPRPLGGAGFRWEMRGGPRLRYAAGLPRGAGADIQEEGRGTLHAVS